MCITVKILLQYKCMKPETFRLYDQPARSKKYENLELGMTKIDKSENRTKTLAWNQIGGSPPINESVCVIVLF